MAFVFRNVLARGRKLPLADLNSVVRQEIEKTIEQQVKKDLIERHEEFVKEWKHKPKFQARKIIKPKRITVSVFPTGPNKEIYGYVDKGTKPHIIKAKNAPTLKFMWGGKGSYVPKTRATPARVIKGGGYVRNPTFRSPLVVHHPGTEAREFGKQIAEDYISEFRPIIENAFRRAARKMEE